MSIARDAGIISEAQQKEIDALFTGKDGKFDEEAFAEAFARELKRAFHETVQKRMEDVPTTKAGRALRRVADFIVTLAKSFAFWRQERGLDPVTGQPLQAGQVLDAFLKRERTAVDEATRLDNLARAARAASLRATAEARDNAPTQAVVDEDGTEVAYHERGGRDVSAEDFARTFGMYAPHSFADETLDTEGDPPEMVAFANVAKEVAQAQANGAYDGLMAIAKLMGVPPETLGLGGLISPSLGRIYPYDMNGEFTPNNGELILPTTVTEEQWENLRKRTEELRVWLEDNARYGLATSTTVHEWFHALDDALASGRNADWRLDDGTSESPSEKYDKNVRFRHPKSDNLVGTSLPARMLSMPEGLRDLFINIEPIADSVRPEVREAFKRMIDAVANTSYGKRQANAKEWLEQYKDELVDTVEKTAIYLFRPDEMLARAFEQTIAETSGSSSKREFYATVYEEPSMADVLSFPTSEEVQELLPIFREFFSALKVGVNETTGVQTLYHEASRGWASDLDSVPKHDGIGEDVLDALAFMLRTGRETTLYTREFGDVLLSFGRFLNQVPGLKGKGFLHVLEERTRKDGLSVLEAIEVILKSVEAAVRGKENKALRQGVRHAIDLNGYRAIVADNGDFREFITGYKIFTNEEKEKRSGVETDAIRQSANYDPDRYGRLMQEGAERLSQRIAKLLEGRQVQKSVEELEQELDDLDVAYYRLFNARKKAEENGASKEELKAFTKDMDENREKHKQVAKAKKKLNRQRAKERKLYGNLGEERRDHIKVWSGARQAYDRVDLRFIGSGTGGNNEGRGAYSSGVRGVAQDKYARGALASPFYSTSEIPVVYDETTMPLGEAVLIVRGTSHDEYDPDAIDEDWMINEIDYVARLLGVENNGRVEYNALRRELEEGFKNSAGPDYGEMLEGYARVLALPVEKRMVYDYGDGFASFAGRANTDKMPDDSGYKIVRSEMREVYDRGGAYYYDAEWVRQQYEELKKLAENATFDEAMYKKKLELLDKMLPELPEPRPAVMEQTWFTNRPEGDVSHLLNWFEAVTPEQMGWIVEAAKKAGFSEEEIAFLQRERIDDDDVLIEDGNRMPSGSEMYMRLELIAMMRDNQFVTFDEVKKYDLWKAHREVMGEVGKFASEFLLTADIDGVMYPVNYRGGSRHGEEGWNYVAFSDEHLRVDHVYEYNPETDDFELKWHTAEGSGPRFTETPLGQELVARAFDAIMGSRVDLLLRPSRYYGNPYETRERNPRNALVTEHLHRDVDVSEPKGFATEVSAEISRFGTREGDPTLREIRARCGSKARFYEVLGAVYETAVGLKMGVFDVITQREFSSMEKRMPLYAWVIRHNAQARATELGRKAYIMGREFAERLRREAVAAARAEVERQRRGRGDCGMIGGKCEGKGPSRHGERRWPKARRMR